jgi:hypothetical protein
VITSGLFGLSWTSPGFRYEMDRERVGFGLFDAPPLNVLRRAELVAWCECYTDEVSKTPLWADMIRQHNNAAEVGQLYRPANYHPMRFILPSGLSFTIGMVVNNWEAGETSNGFRTRICVKNFGTLPSGYHWPDHPLWNQDLYSLVARQKAQPDIAHVLADWLEERGEESFARTVLEVKPELVVPLISAYREAVCQRELNWPGWERHVADWYNAATRPPDDDLAEASSDDWE